MASAERKVSHRDHGDLPSFLLPPKPVDLERLEEAFAIVLSALGQDHKTEVMQNTPRRIAELYAETINPPFVDIEKELKTFANPGMTDMVLVSDVHYTSMCEHHLAPSFGVAHFAYVPNERVVGYSKAKKALNYLARQPQLNERIVVDAVDFLEQRLKPKGIALALRSVHCCIALRTNAPMQEVVTVVERRGVLAEEPFRSEFWSTVIQSRPLFLGA
jgi:GTP cyclohydrolase I